MTITQDEHTDRHAVARAVLVDAGIDIDQADTVAVSAAAASVELVPWRLVLDELLDAAPTRYAADPQRGWFDLLGAVITLDESGLRCVPAPVVRAVLADVRRAEAERIERDVAEVLARRRKPRDHDDEDDEAATLAKLAKLEARLEAILADGEMSEQLQAQFVVHLADRIRALREPSPPPAPEVAGVFFRGASDETVERAFKDEMKLARQRKFGRRRVD